MNALTVAPWLSTIVLFGLWLNQGKELSRQIEVCNQSKLTAVAEAEALVRQAERANHEQELQAQRELLLRETKARRIAEAARLEAEARPEQTRTIIKEITHADPTSCLTQPVPAELIDSLRQ